MMFVFLSFEKHLFSTLGFLSKLFGAKYFSKNIFQMTGPIFTENIIAGVVTSFLFAGLEPVSAITTFCLYELVRHPEMQERLFQEIQSARKESCGEIKYEDLKKLRYLDQVVNGKL